jgi:hypothetical protein
MHNSREVKNLAYFMTITIAMLLTAGTLTRTIGRASAEASETRASNALDAANAASYAATRTNPDGIGIPTTPTAPDPVNLAAARINRLLSCQANGDNCPIETVQAVASNDPRAVYFAVSQAISNELADLLPLSENPGPDNGSEEAALADLSRRMLIYDEDRVRLAALNIIYHLPTSPENLNAIIQGLSDSNDPELYEHAIVVFQRYVTEEDQQKIAGFLADTMIHGSPAVSQAVALHISTLLDPVTTAIVENSLSSLPAGSSRYVRLRAALHMNRAGD